MKIEYEKGDVAFVADTEVAGELAGCEVELQSKNGMEWYCKNLDLTVSANYSWIEELWLKPCSQDM